MARPRRRVRRLRDRPSPIIARRHWKAAPPKPRPPFLRRAGPLPPSERDPRPNRTRLRTSPPSAPPPKARALGCRETAILRVENIETGPKRARGPNLLSPSRRNQTERSTAPRDPPAGRPGRQCSWTLRQRRPARPMTRKPLRRQQRTAMLSEVEPIPKRPIPKRPIPKRRARRLVRTPRG